MLFRRTNHVYHVIHTLYRTRHYVIRATGTIYYYRELIVELLSRRRRGLERVEIDNVAIQRHVSYLSPLFPDIPPEIIPLFGDISSMMFNLMSRNELYYTIDDRVAWLLPRLWKTKRITVHELIRVLGYSWKCQTERLRTFLRGIITDVTGLLTIYWKKHTMEMLLGIGPPICAGNMREVRAICNKYKTKYIVTLLRRTNIFGPDSVPTIFAKHSEGILDMIHAKGWTIDPVHILTRSTIC